MKNKTIAVAYMKSFANNMLKGEDPDQKDVRLGVSLMLEEVLHRTGNYKGFRYINLGEPNFDSTRRMYF